MVQKIPSELRKMIVSYSIFVPNLMYRRCFAKTGGSRQRYIERSQNLTKLTIQYFFPNQLHESLGKCINRTGGYPA